MFDGFNIIERAGALIGRKRPEKKKWVYDPENDPVPELHRLSPEELQAGEEYSIWYEGKIDGISNQLTFNEAKRITVVGGMVKDRGEVSLTLTIRGNDKTLFYKKMKGALALEEHAALMDWQFGQLNKGATIDEISEFLER